jgi:GH25 family lysozyme M1 (1,4-beta-N-acetylmuramidase)
MSVTPRRVDGVDISHHQAGSLDLAAAKRRGLKWLYHKATEGDNYTDPNYARRRAEAEKAGLPFGAYHFARPEKSDAAAEARRFLAVAKPKPGDLRPALDLETQEGLSLADIRVWAATWIATVTKALGGVKPIVYTPFDLGAADDGCLLWRPRYNNTNTPPALRWDIWQFSNGTFGVPHSLAGIGNVDLNTMRPGLDLDAMLIPKPEPKPQRETQRLHVMHASLQFSDSDPQHTSDITKIFGRAKDRQVAWITGTEAGPGAGNTSDELLRIGEIAGYRMWVPSHQRKGKPGWATDCWLGVREDLIQKGSWTRDYLPAIPGSAELNNDPAWAKIIGRKRWGPKGLVTAGWVNEDLGKMSLGAAHYLTDARNPSSPYWDLNKNLAGVISKWAIEAGAGSGLAFYGGDQNMADNKDTEPQGDTFFGGPLTSASDETGQRESTGHGQIDVIASYDHDGRVSAAYWRALDDREFPLNTDHYITEAGFDVAVLKG